MKYVHYQASPMEIKMYCTMHNVSYEVAKAFLNERANTKKENTTTNFNGKHIVGNQICKTRVCKTCIKKGRI